jgi:iron complex transport system ATP-binding protein
MTARLVSEDLSTNFGKTPILSDVSVSLPDGKITSIVGPNASGKTTLLRCLARLLVPTKGAVLLDGTSIQRQKTRVVARQIALLPQKTEAPASMRVLDLVKQGRTPHQNPLRQWSQEDQTIVARCIETVGLNGLETALLSEISGGQRQRVWIAMALAQDTDILLLDEPTTYLDMTHQISLLKLIRSLQRTRAMTVAMVVHDINLAARFSDYVIAIKDHKVHCEGTPVEVITEASIQSIFGLDADVISAPTGNYPHVIAR